MKHTFIALCLFVIGCGEVRAPDQGSQVDAAHGDAAGSADRGPKARGISAAGRRTSSPRFVLMSVTGQPTPVGARRNTSSQFVHVPGILGGQ